MDNSCRMRSDSFLKMLRLVASSVRRCLPRLVDVELAFLIMDHSSELHLFSLFEFIYRV